MKANYELEHNQLNKKKQTILSIYAIITLRLKYLDRYMMTQQKLETELTKAVMRNIQTIVQFLINSTEYQHQTALIKKMQSMLNKVQDDLTHGNNRFTSKGTTAAARTTEWLKMAVAYTNDLKTMDGEPYSSKEKAHLISVCMMQVATNITDIPDDIARHIPLYLTHEERISAAKSINSFKDILTTDLLSAVFMGEEELAVIIVRAHPDSLFATGTYKMPLLNQDGTPSTESEQIYRNTTPLQLMFYTGDWKMWERILPLIPEARLKETLQEMRNISRGGPDLVKINRDPTQLSAANLRHYYAQNDDGTYMLDSSGAIVIYDLLHNRNGLFYRELDNNHVQFFEVDIHPETQEKTVTEVLVPENMTKEDQEALNALKQDIHQNMTMNSSRRTSDAEHALIHRLFGVTLERNGIRYSLNGKDYQDTHDGCIRLKNAYRKYINFKTEDEKNIIGASWVGVVGMAQRQTMVHVIQRFCEKGKPFYPLEEAKDLQSRAFFRTSQFGHWLWLTASTIYNAYPLRAEKGLGVNFGLFKGASTSPSWSSASHATRIDLDGVKLIDKVTQASLNEHISELEQRLNPSPGQAYGPG